MVLYRQMWIVVNFEMFAAAALVNWGDAEYLYYPAFGIWSDTLLWVRYANEYQFELETDLI